MRLEDVFAEVGIAAPHDQPLREVYLTAECPECGEHSSLRAMDLREDESQTEYLCFHCGAVAIVITTSGGPGYRLRGQADRDYWLRLKSLVFHYPGQEPYKVAGSDIALP